jgi:hypothetical protein
VSGRDSGGSRWATIPSRNAQTRCENARPNDSKKSTMALMWAYGSSRLTTSAVAAEINA